MNPLPGTVPAAAPKGQPSSKETRMNKDQVKGRIKEATDETGAKTCHSYAQTTGGSTHTTSFALTASYRA